ncbi:putative porin [Methylophilus sp. QUAN]|uniref:putative porin n=1 Tax=Methylophilus sp. QUAN TaxID=2781020 RepID=UPI00188F119B|nr:putative porin [Methylophilus sp. QUAN]MBF4991213.1 putative porin [Methylophilus sp. QUAN]
MNIKAKNWMIPLVVASLFGTQSASISAGERESLEEVRATTMSLIELLVQEGVLSKEKADTLLQQAQQARQKAKEEAEALAAQSPQPVEQAVAGQSKAIRVQYVPEHVKNEMRAEIEQDVMKKLNYKAGERLGIPEWIDRIEWTGALRLRYQQDMFGDSNAIPGSLNNEVQNMVVNNSTEDRERQRVRAFFGANIHINDWLDGGIRFTTGMLQTPVTPNQTEGFSQGKFVFGLDRAFLEAKPYDWLTLTGGRFANPFFTGNQVFGTDLLWDPDLAFDGFVARANPAINRHWKLFSSVGAFPIEEVESSNTNKAGDKWLYAAQGGIEWTASNDSKVKLGVAYYDFKNVEGQRNPVNDSLKYAGTVPLWRQKGNHTFSLNDGTTNGALCGSTNGLCGLASQFQLINFTGEVDLAVFDPVHVILHGAYVQNIGFDEKEIQRRTGNTYRKENEGYELSLMVGHPMIKKLHDWQVFGGYRRLEADAMLDGFTDSNFRLGGTDAKGFYVGAQYGVGKNAWLSSRYVSADEISGLPFSVDTFFVDFNGRF